MKQNYPNSLLVQDTLRSTVVASLLVELLVELLVVTLRRRKEARTSRGYCTTSFIMRLIFMMDVTNKTIASPCVIIILILVQSCLRKPPFAPTILTTQARSSY
jgi:hypothetical protein